MTFFWPIFDFEQLVGFCSFLTLFSLIASISLNLRRQQANPMAHRSFLVASILLSCLAAASCDITFASLKKSLVVTASPRPGQVFMAGEGNITVTWSLNTTFPKGVDSEYKTVKVKLCYALISQQERAWRKSNELVSKDKSCQHMIIAKPYSALNNFTWTVQRDVPTATYFIRAYVYDSLDKVVAYGQTTDEHKATNLFNVQGISGRHVSLDIAAACFSAFSVVSLFGFFYLYKFVCPEYEAILFVMPF